MIVLGLILIVVGLVVQRRILLDVGFVLVVIGALLYAIDYGAY